ncbi:hypothetical protein PGSY75_1007400 [Plasmodium gaboni]|uniref:Uncharacterized protein n=1 Tax=Plasmodium gaboni TaxID=647221 RepID=A0A151LKG1_9APIC|nr:hypothetical protein PGSY75_1007400 [Plasmodium gaboni]KYN99451.1 hypothetical protein PGSY75_1007400 [Plasmodium gaboni]SOV14634.1 conserved Plasmodium protein, unknown function [Plasmodium gaboni]
MNFVKTHIYKQEYTEDGILEIEQDTRSSKEKDAEKILKELPEFKRDNQFLSLSEQLELKKITNNKENVSSYDNENNMYDIINGMDNPTEYDENYDMNNNYSFNKLQQREKEIAYEYNEAIKDCFKKKEQKDKNNFKNLPEENINIKEIKKKIIKQKNKKILNPNIKAIIKTKKKNENKKTDKINDVDNNESKHSNDKNKENVETKQTCLLYGYSDYSDN